MALFLHCVFFPHTFLKLRQSAKEQILKCFKENGLKLISMYSFLIFIKQILAILGRNYTSASKGGEIRDTKTLNLSSNIVSLQVLVDVSRFSPCMINLTRNENICCGLKKVVAKRRARVYFERQILALLLVSHQTHDLSRNNFARALANRPISALHFFNPQKCFRCGSS